MLAKKQLSTIAFDNNGTKSVDIGSGCEVWNRHIFLMSQNARVRAVKLCHNVATDD
jgi:hypothetical protein